MRIFSSADMNRLYTDKLSTDEAYKALESMGKSVNKMNKVSVVRERRTRSFAAKKVGIHTDGVGFIGYVETGEEDEQDGYAHAMQRFRNWNSSDWYREKEDEERRQRRQKPDVLIEPYEGYAPGGYLKHDIEAAIVYLFEAKPINGYGLYTGKLYGGVTNTVEHAAEMYGLFPETLTAYMQQLESFKRLKKPEKTAGGSSKPNDLLQPVRNILYALGIVAEKTNAAIADAVWGCGSVAGSMSNALRPRGCPSFIVALTFLWSLYCVSNVVALTVVPLLLTFIGMSAMFAATFSVLTSIPIVLMMMHMIFKTTRHGGK